MGETIRIKQQFSEEVVVQGGEVNLGLRIGTTEDYVRRAAKYVCGAGTDTLTYEYQVVEGDLDSDGLVVPDSNYGGTGSILTLEYNGSVNSNYIGAEGDAGHKVYGGPYFNDIPLSSTPTNGDIYRFGEEIEIDVLFDRAVQVEETAAVRVKIGADDDARIDADYNSGSGTDTLLLGYEVLSGDVDPDGISLEPGYVHDDGRTHGLSLYGAVSGDFNGQLMDRYYDGREEHLGRKVDGRPYVTVMALTSTPPNGERYRIGDEIRTTAAFDQDLLLVPPLNVPLTLGDGYNAETWGPAIPATLGTTCWSSFTGLAIIACVGSREWLFCSARRPRIGKK